MNDESDACTTDAARGEARSESLRPTRAGGCDRHGFEFVGVERQHDLEPDTCVEHGLRHEDVGAGGEGSVGKADPAFRDERPDLLLDVGLEVRRKATRTLCLVDEMAAVIQDERGRERVERPGVGPNRFAHEAQLATGHGHRGVVLAGDLHCDAKRGGGRVDVADDQRGFGFGRFLPIVVGRSRRAVGRDEAARLVRQLARPVDVAREQSQRRGVDAREEPSELLRGGLVEVCGPAQEVAPAGSVRCQRLVLGESRDERGRIFPQRDRNVDGGREPSQQLGCGKAGSPDRARPSECERRHEPRLEVIRFGFDRRHRLVVPDEHVAPRDRGASLPHQVVGHARKVPRGDRPVARACRHRFPTSESGSGPARSDPPGLSALRGCCGS